MTWITSTCTLVDITYVRALARYRVRHGCTMTIMQHMLRATDHVETTAECGMTIIAHMLTIMDHPVRSVECMETAMKRGVSMESGDVPRTRQRLWLDRFDTRTLESRCPASTPVACLRLHGSEVCNGRVLITDDGTKTVSARPR